MCGISGIYNFNGNNSIDDSVLTSMANEMIHRGPDELSTFLEGNIGFGFRRLSIIDILNGQQPFFRIDNSVVLICNKYIIIKNCVSSSN